MTVSLEAYCALFDAYCRDISQRVLAMQKLMSIEKADAISLCVHAGVLPLFSVFEAHQQAEAEKLRAEHDAAVAQVTNTTTITHTHTTSIPNAAVATATPPPSASSSASSSVGSSSVPPPPSSNVEPLSGLEVDQLDALTTKMERWQRTHQKADHLTVPSYAAIAQEIGGDRNEPLHKRIEKAITEGHAQQLRRVISAIAWEG